MKHKKGYISVQPKTFSKPIAEVKFIWEKVDILGEGIEEGMNGSYRSYLVKRKNGEIKKVSDIFIEENV